MILEYDTTVLWLYYVPYFLFLFFKYLRTYVRTGTNKDSLGPYYKYIRKGTYRT